MLRRGTGHAADLSATACRGYTPDEALSLFRLNTGLEAAPISPDFDGIQQRPQCRQQRPCFRRLLPRRISSTIPAQQQLSLPRRQHQAITTALAMVGAVEVMEMASRRISRQLSSVWSL